MMNIYFMQVIKTRELQGKDYHYAIWDKTVGLGVGGGGGGEKKGDNK